MKISRIFQPRNPMFWLMMLLNLMSSLLAWVTHTQALAAWVSVVIVCFAIGNALFGAWLAWRLAHT
ncbi:hypothetical protein [Rhodoferax aquaticus]|uniref:Uncharacterized protein n=1 Tax=Rhodoferax aquaticus TaxID=2527691 RepID=A0A515EQV1_9BURK|nr:hypothetical protein [Rhodoferax aquaticus]QDL55042.1 hypothetical protein EXZ61_13185 [Rhodoferax aquaticus]